MELLERDGALAALAGAHDAAARGGGSVVFVTGEPGIGKTSLVTRFVEGLDGRVLVGTCDDLSIPRPFGPFRDLVGSAAPELEDALADGAAHDVHTLLIGELERPPWPTVLVLEDVHWADDATFDTIMVLGRRIGSLPALLVLTFRGGEAPPGHPLYGTIGAIRADDSVMLELAPLSERAVRSLCGSNGARVYHATGGNPFYVNEIIAAREPSELPASIANSVLGRASRLDDDSRRLVELVSVVPSRVRMSLLDAVMPDWTAAAEEPERRQLLEVDHGYVRFRHELARHAIRSSLPLATRRRLHAEMLDALIAAKADPADIVHHAEAAGAEDVVADHALIAARRAAAVESNREAFSHYRRAYDFVDRLSPPDEACAIEEYAMAAYAVGNLEVAFGAIEHATGIYAMLGDAASMGRSMRIMSRFHWYASEGDAARAKAREAVAILEPLGESPELARAYSGISQLAMLSEDTAGALEWGERALELAIRLGDESTRVHALVNIGAAMMQLDERETGPLLEAHAMSDAVGDPHEATRAIANLGYCLMCWVEPESALHYSERGLAYAREHEVHTLAPYIAMVIAWLKLRAGEWDEAERAARRELECVGTVAELLARTVLAELAVRRGDPDAEERLTDAAAQAGDANELQRIVPILELEAEWALTSGGSMPGERFARIADDLRARRNFNGWTAARIAAWSAVAGVDVELNERLAAPHAAMMRRDWSAAADAFGAVGWTYDRALMLSLLDDEQSLAESLEIARGLGAEPLAKRATARMRKLGLRVPRGPRETTRDNPAGLTARQREVLALVIEGLTNAEIADRLVVSPRTAEHHVAAVLTKLGAASRRDAARRASYLGITA